MASIVAHHGHDVELNGLQIACVAFALPSYDLLLSQGSWCPFDLKINPGHDCLVFQ